MGSNVLQPSNLINSFATLHIPAAYGIRTDVDCRCRRDDVTSGKCSSPCPNV